MTLSDIKPVLKDFIIKNYLKKGSRIVLADTDSFLEKGILDSIGVIELASFIQRTFNFRIKVPEIVPDNFDSLDNLERYIKSKIK